MAAHQFTLTGTKAVQIARTRKKRTAKLSTLAAQLTQETLEHALADCDSTPKREAVYAKLKPALAFTPHEDTLMQAWVRRAIRDEIHLVSTILQMPPGARQRGKDLLLPLCSWTPSADALQVIDNSIPSGIVTADGKAVNATTPAPPLVLTDLR
jgi:hypothetical protein